MLQQLEISFNFLAFFFNRRKAKLIVLLRREEYLYNWAYMQHKYSMTALIWLKSCSRKSISSSHLFYQIETKWKKKIYRFISLEKELQTILPRFSNGIFSCSDSFPNYLYPKRNSLSIFFLILSTNIYWVPSMCKEL